MSNLTYLRSDLDEAKDATITVTDENASYPKANLQAEPVAKTYRSTTDSDIRIDMDLGSAKSLDCAALINHNISSGATITLYADSTSTPTANANTFTHRVYDMYEYLSSPLSYRYWAIRIQDASNPDGYIEVGRVLLGDALTITQNYYRMTRTPRFINARYGSDFLSPEVKALSRIYGLTFDWRNLTKAQADNITDVWDGLSGDAEPILIIPDTDDAECYYGRFAGTYSETAEIMDFRSLSLSFLEDGRGRTIAA